jgi:PPK2 family polyphosphate:nucleotide phosphotransferase
MIDRHLIEQLKVAPGRRLKLQDRDSGWAQTEELRELGKDAVKERSKEILDANLARLAETQERLYADDRYAVLVILQGIDAAGKDGTIKHVTTGLNPQGCQVHSFKQPSREELDHNFLWRHMTRLPERGRIGIFNRSYYEDVIVVRVHPELLDGQQLPPRDRGPKLWQERYEDINAFEQHLTRNGTLIVKFFLNISKDEQRRRLLDRIDRPEKNWKFSLGDLAERAHWDDYQSAYEEMLSATSTEWAPWYVVPADQKWITRAVVADILSSRLQELDLRFPEVSETQRAELRQAREQLLAEGK